MILSARYIHSPRYARRCDECGTRLGPHIRLYGNAYDTDPMHTLRLCPTCIHPASAAREPKIAAAMAEAQRRAGDVAAEQLVHEFDPNGHWVLSRAPGKEISREA